MAKKKYSRMKEDAKTSEEIIKVYTLWLVLTQIQSKLDIECPINVQKDPI